MGKFTLKLELIMILDQLPYLTLKDGEWVNPYSANSIGLNLSLLSSPYISQWSCIEPLSPDKNFSNGIVSDESTPTGTGCQESSVPALVALPGIVTISPSDPSATSDIEEDDVEEEEYDILPKEEDEEEDDDDEIEYDGILLLDEDDNEEQDELLSLVGSYIFCR